MTDALVLPPLLRTSLADATAELIRERIFSGAFEPGMWLVETDMARQLHTSRAPVREALAMLRAEGLAREEPGRGTHVATLDRRDIEEIYEVRAGLESVAARLVIERNDEAALAALDQRLEEMRRTAEQDDHQAFVDADLALHGELCRLSGNGRLLRAWDAQVGLLRTLIRIEVTTLIRTMEPLLTEHARVVDEIRSGDPARAAAACWALFRGASHILTERMAVDIRGQSRNDTTRRRPGSGATTETPR